GFAVHSGHGSTPLVGCRCKTRSSMPVLAQSPCRHGRGGRPGKPVQLSPRREPVGPSGRRWSETRATGSGLPLFATSDLRTWTRSIVIAPCDPGGLSCQASSSYWWVLPTSGPHCTIRFYPSLDASIAQRLTPCLSTAKPLLHCH